jgi:metallo-beta-lactamase family protein
MHLIETRAGSILLDCGMYQGRREEANQRNRNLAPQAVKARALILSHAHVDHSGAIPILVKLGFEGPIYATPATRDLCQHMLRDSARIQVADAEYLNRRFADDPTHIPVEPLYDEDHVERALTHFRAVPYFKPFPVIEGIEARFIDAGHILGSAQVLLGLTENGKTVHLAFSGDLGRKALPILRDPDPVPPPTDYLVMETTYGNRVHGKIEETHDRLEHVVNETVKRGGKVLIPAFALGRTQEIVYALNQLKKAGRLPDVPVFIDSPLSVDVTQVFKAHPECFDEEAEALYKRDGDIFDFKGVEYIHDREESIRLNTLQGPAIIIASSGMCEAGRILHHLQNRVEDEKNTIVIVGFQAQHTLGRRLVERRPRVRILGVERELHARVEVLNGFSAHADRDALFAYARQAAAHARRIFLVHGEPDQQEAFKKNLEGNGLHATIPAPKDIAELD